ncbi:MAG TPA: hypothetical protein VFZ01_16370 [Geminicoccaceae bacterium]
MVEREAAEAGARPHLPGRLVDQDPRGLVDQRRAAAGLHDHRAVLADVGAEVELGAQAPDQGIAAVEELRMALADVVEAHDLAVEAGDLLELRVRLLDQTMDLLIGLGAQALDLVGEAVDLSAQLAGEVQDLGAERVALRVRGKRIEGGFELAEPEHEVGVLARPAEKILDPAVEPVNHLGLAGRSRLTPHLEGQEAVDHPHRLAGADARAPARDHLGRGIATLRV